MKRIYQNADLGLTMEGIRLQIQDSIPYAKINCHYTNPKDIYTFLKRQVTYKNDPPGIELVQSMQTLFENNYYGVPGMGDCDCFTTTYTACCIAARVPVCIVLAGRKKNQFVHIYNAVKYLGEWVPADLTQPTFNDERYYAYKKYLLIDTK
jgi:hypothetical protein